MNLVAVFHIVRGEYNFVPINLVLGEVAAFIAYGRLFVRPIAPASITAFRVLKRLAVLAAGTRIGGIRFVVAMTRPALGRLLLISFPAKVSRYRRTFFRAPSSSCLPTKASVSCSRLPRA